MCLGVSECVCLCVSVRGQDHESLVPRISLDSEVTVDDSSSPVQGTPYLAIVVISFFPQNDKGYYFAPQQR